MTTTKYDVRYGKPKVRHWKLLPNPNWRCDYCGEISTNQFEYAYLFPNGDKDVINRVETCDSCGLYETGV